MKAIQRWGLIGLLLCLGPATVKAASFTLSIQGPEATRNQAFAEIINHLAGDRWQVVPGDGQVIVALGDMAFLAALQAPRSRPVLGVAIDRTLARHWVKPTCQCSAIWRGVPLATQLRVLRAMAPGAKRVGVLLGPHSVWEPPPPELDGLSLQAAWVGVPRLLGQQLRNRLSGWDALLLPNDGILFGAGAAKLILLTSYRQRVPVFGPDAGYVRAGSVASAYASAEDIARAVVDRLNHWQQRGRLPAPGFADHYSLIVNRHVARAYDLIIQDRTGLEQALENTPWD